MGTILSVLGSVIVKILLFLLFLLLFLLVLAGCILWIPIRYRFYGNYGEEKVLQGKASWLLHLVHAQIQYEEEWNISFRILGIDIVGLLKKRADKKAAKKAKKRKRQLKKAQKAKQPKESLQAKEQPEDMQRQTESKEDLSIAQISGQTDQDISNEDNTMFSTETSDKKESETSDTKVSEISDRKKSETHDTKVSEISDRKESETSEQKESEEAGKKKKRRFSLIERIKKWIRSIKNAIAMIRKRIRQAGWLKALWQDDNTQALVCILKDNVLHLWRKCKPKKLEAKICFGTEQPDTTGEILALLAIFYAYYGSSVTIIPDFEQARLEGWIRMKGHISVFTVLVILVKIYMSKEWNQFRKDISRWKEAF